MSSALVPHRNPRLRRLLASLLGLGLAFAACSNQGEGERCVPENDNLDCQSGLECVQSNDLRDQSVTLDTQQSFGRCCPPEGEPVNDNRCVRGALNLPGSSSAGSAGEVGTAGASGSLGGASEGGAAGAAPEPEGGAAGAAEVSAAGAAGA